MELQNTQEDIDIVNKMSELSKLLKKPNIVCFCFFSLTEMIFSLFSKKVRLT